MKYIKSILVIAITASVAGSVVWHLMWMTEIEKKLRTGQSSVAADKMEVKEKKNKSQGVKAEKTRPAAGQGAVSVQESRTQMYQAEKTLPEGDKSVNSKADPGAVIPEGRTTAKSEKDTAKWFERDIGLGKKVRQVKPGPGETTVEISNDKTMSVTIKNNARPGMQKNIPQPQQMERPAVKVTGVTSYPTSTTP